MPVHMLDLHCLQGDISSKVLVLLMQTEVLTRKVTKAAQQLRALMPAIPWERRLTHDSNLWMTFWTLLDDSNFGVTNH